MHLYTCESHIHAHKDKDFFNNQFNKQTESDRVYGPCGGWKLISKQKHTQGTGSPEHREQVISPISSVGRTKKDFPDAVSSSRSQLALWTLCKSSKCEPLMLSSRESLTPFPGKGKRSFTHRTPARFTCWDRISNSLWGMKRLLCCWTWYSFQNMIVLQSADKPSSHTTSRSPVWGVS